MKTKTTQTVIENLKQKITERKLQVSNLYADYAYKTTIKQIVDEKLGKEPEYQTVSRLIYSPHEI